MTKTIDDNAFEVFGITPDAIIEYFYEEYFNMFKCAKEFASHEKEYYSENPEAKEIEFRPTQIKYMFHMIHTLMIRGVLIGVDFAACCATDKKHLKWFQEKYCKEKIKQND